VQYGQTRTVQSADLELPAGLTGVSTARRWAASVCRKWGFPDEADVVSLLVSELVTNAVIHAGRPVRLHLAQPDGAVRVEVRDPDPRVPAVGEPGTLSEHGRGMVLLDELASSWGVDTREPLGKVVWFEVAGSGSGAR
jgi:anti-sigma regulatory factor (Ser/Thr protein kinase)